MTKSRSRFLVGAFLSCLAVWGCASSPGVAVDAIAQPGIAQAYIPLGMRTRMALGQAVGAGVNIAPGIGVTNAHNRNLLDPRRVMGEAADYDLLFFHTADFSPAIASAAPSAGMAVIAYGQGSNYELRRAAGMVREITPAPGGGPPAYFIFSNAKPGVDDAGPGFSGGPVIDQGGHLLGIVFGFKNDEKSGQRLIFAYDMARVRAELSALQNQPATPQN